jgi:PAT family beta-lactamase induction signal transducer AmpG
VYVGPAAGYATDPKFLGLSWPTFFFSAFIVALPGLVFVWLLRKEIERAEAASA